MKIYINSNLGRDFVKDFFKRIDPDDTQTNVYTEKYVREVGYNGDYRDVILIRLEQINNEKICIVFKSNVLSLELNTRLLNIKVWRGLLDKISLAYPDAMFDEN